MSIVRGMVTSFVLVSAWSHSLVAQEAQDPNQAIDSQAKESLAKSVESDPSKAPDIANAADPNEPAPAKAKTIAKSEATSPATDIAQTAKADETADAEKQAATTDAQSGSVNAVSEKPSSATTPDAEDPANALAVSDKESSDASDVETGKSGDAAAAMTTQERSSRPLEAEKSDSAPAMKPASEMSLADVIALVQQQQEQLATQRKQLDAQSKQIASLSEELDTLRAPPPALTGGNKDSETPAFQPDSVIAQADSDIESESEEASKEDTPAKTTDEIKQQTGDEVLVAQADDPTRALLDDFPGAWRLPGTQAALSIGGYVKASAVINQDPLEIKDRFIVGSIPVAGDNPNSVKAESSLSASQSRLNFDLREPTDVGTMRAFIEGDFAEDNDTFRLRHAFGQWDRMLAGKTWSAFVDTLASPEEVDFEGLNGRIRVRQSQLRFSPRIGEDFSMVLSLEDPNPQIQDGSGVTRIPDVVVAGRFEPHERLHMKVGMLGRQIRGQTEGERSVVKKKAAWGLTLSGRFTTPILDDRDGLLFQLSGGTAIGRYVNDLGSVGSYDGIFDEDGNLELFDVLSGYVSYQHWWGEVTRSNFTVGVVDVGNPGFVEGDAYKRTVRASANLIWTPTPRVDVGWELLWGERTNQDNASGDALQTQFMARYRFSQQ
ncbi:MAG: DcaP family trimeric outer membrane transporter [Halioglobus sp.]